VTTPAEDWHFDTARIGRRVLVFDELESTNTFASSQPTADDGLAIVARNQTGGRGRFGRVWRSRPGGALLLSVILQPPSELRRASVLTATAAVAVGDAVFGLTGLQTKIKWPNDLLVRGKKVCGILIEQGRATVVGIGLNLNQTAEEFDSAGLPDATSLAMLSGREFDLRTAAEAVLTRLDGEYGRLLAGERVAVEADWKWRTGLLARHVAVELADGTTVRGRLIEMSFAGLDVETDGGVRRIVPETVEHVRPTCPDRPA
jgi:BirA family biotin operon repressor/biotin-[acetyl-CoA-carboxylase] ligase